MIDVFNEGTKPETSAPTSRELGINPLKVQVAGDHYKKMGIQPVEYAHKNDLNFCQGSVVKYITRYKNKNGLEDLKKAKHFIDLLIALEYPESIND